MELNEKTLEEILSRQRQEYEHSLAKRDEKLDTVVASLGALDTKVGALDTKVGALEKKVDALDKKVGALDTRVGALDTKVAALDTKVNSMDLKIDQTEGRLEAAIIRQGEDYQRYMSVWAEDLKGRIQLATEGISTHFTEVSKINTEDDKNKRTILKLEIEQLVLDGRIRKKADREDLTELEARVKKLETSR